MAAFVSAGFDVGGWVTEHWGRAYGFGAGCLRLLLFSICV